MAVYRPYDLNFEGGGPTPAEVDSIGSRLAVVRGITNAAKQTMVSAAAGPRVRADAVLTQASDAIQQSIQDNLQPAMQSTYQAFTIARGAAVKEMDAARQLLKPTSDILNPPQEPVARKRRTRNAPALAVPPGCRVVPPPPGSFGADQVICDHRLPPAPPSPPGLPPSPSSPPAGGGSGIIWTMLINCCLHELAAIPNATSAQKGQLANEGWLVFANYPIIDGLTPAEMQVWLQQNATLAQTVCNSLSPQPICPFLPAV